MIGWLCLALLLVIGGAVLAGADLISTLPIDPDSVAAELGTTIAVLIAVIFIEIFNRHGPIGLLRSLNSILAAIIVLVSLAVAVDDWSQATTDDLDVAAVSSPAATSAYRRSISIAPGASGVFSTTASINGRSVNILIDTGATLVALRYEDADALGLRPSSLTYSTPLATANGKVEGAEVTLTSVTVDNIRVDDVLAVVLPRGALSTSLLGLSYLNRIGGFERKGSSLILSE